MKYKYKLEQVVYPVGAKRLFSTGTTKHSQKWVGRIIGRYKKEEQNYYVVSSDSSLHFVREEKLTTKKEQVLGYVLVTDIGVSVVYQERPEVVPQGSVLVALSGIPHD